MSESDAQTDLCLKLADNIISVMVAGPRHVREKELGSEPFDPPRQRVKLIADCLRGPPPKPIVDCLLAAKTIKQLAVCKRM